MHLRCLQHWVVPVPKASPDSYAKPGNPPHTEKSAAKASFPCQLFHKSRRRDRLFPSSGQLSFQWVWRGAGSLCQSPPHCSAGCCSPLAELGQPRGMADCPKHSRNRPHSWYKIHLLSSHTRKGLVLARPEEGIRSILPLLFAT